MRKTPKPTTAIRVRHFFFVIVVLIVWLSLPREAWTQEITKVRGSQVLIQNFSGNSGDTFFALDADGKRRGIIKIDRVKNGRAIGTIQKGRASPGFTLITRTGGGGSSKSSRFSAKGLGKLGIGAIAGYSMDSMSVPLASGRATVAMTGSGFSVKGVGDYNLTSSLGLRLGAGMERFSVKGSSNASGSIVDYTTEITYLVLDGIGRYFITQSDFALWVGAGVGVGIPMSKTTTILAEESIATSSLLFLAGGADLKLSGDFYIPFQVDYAMFLPASDVKTSIIGIKTGVMMKF
ncbi:MAG: hypothetical protein AB7F59_06755 [Bdellovibrionales bacterium]